MSDSKHKGEHLTETPDVSYIKNVDVTHETSDVYIGGIAKFAVGLFVLTVAVYVLVWGLFRLFEARNQDPPPAPMALSAKERMPPEPRLQSAPGFAEELGDKAKAVKTEEPAIPVHVPPEGGTPNQSAVRDPKDALWEIKVLREQWADVLEHGPVDQNGTRYGMPIERAKEEILRKGLPVREGSR